MSNHDTIKYIWSYYNFHEKVFSKNEDLNGMYTFV